MKKTKNEKKILTKQKGCDKISHINKRNDAE